jgi:Tfp pilus assembly protein PilN
MTHYLDIHQLNAAPRAQKHLPIVWLLLIIGAVAFVASLYPLIHELTRLSEAKSAQAALVKVMHREAAEKRKLLAEQSNTAAMERESVRAQIQESVHMSWDGIFDALEVAADTVHAGVSILSLAPTRVNGTATQLNISALAANTPIMLAYIEALKKDPRVLQAELATQQPDEKVGPTVLRFRVSAVLNPKINVPHAARETASAPAPAPTGLAASLPTAQGISGAIFPLQSGNSLVPAKPASAPPKPGRK